MFGVIGLDGDVILRGGMVTDRHKLEKVYTDRPTSGQYMVQILKHLFSLTFLMESGYLIAYYIVNHVKGVKRIQKGEKTRIRPTVLIRDAERIFIGKHCTINHNNIMWAGKKNARIVIGDHVMTGPNVQMFAFNHGIERGTEMIDQPVTEQDIIIENNVWIGAGVTILSGAVIGQGVVVGAGSVVTGKLPPYTICAGNPAKVIRSR